MHAVRLDGPNDVRLEELPVPAPGPEDIVVQMRACGLCSSDVLGWYVARKAPLVLGHEPAGVVAAVGKAVRGFRPGDRVFVHHHAPCFRCRTCRRGAYVHCPAWRRSRLDPGGMAEYFRVPGHNLADTLLLPDGLSFADGALVEPVACCVKALRRARLRPGDTVLVVGLGFMGQVLARLARAFGAGRVVGADLRADRRALALRLGADAVVDPAAAPLWEGLAAVNGGRRADAVIVTPADTGAMAAGVDAAGPDATVVLFSPAPPGAALSLDPHRLYFDEVSIVPSYSCGPEETRQALAFLQAGVVRAADLVERCYPLDEAPQAYRDVASGRVLKALVVSGSGDPAPGWKSGHDDG